MLVFFIYTGLTNFLRLFQKFKKLRISLIYEQFLQLDNKNSKTSGDEQIKDISRQYTHPYTQIGTLTKGQRGH